MPYIFYFFSTPPPPPPPTTTSFPLGGTKFSSSFFLQFNSLHMPLAPTPHFYGRTPWEEGKSKCLPLIFCFPSSEHWILVTVHSILFYLISITLQAKGDSINYTIFFSIANFFLLFHPLFNSLNLKFLLHRWVMYTWKLILDCSYNLFLGVFVLSVASTPLC